MNDGMDRTVRAEGDVAGERRALGDVPLAPLARRLETTLSLQRSVEGRFRQRRG